MSGDRVDQLVTEYRNQLRLPWSRTLAGPQRVWMVVYDPELERRLRLKLEEFAIETREAGHSWELIDLTASFAEWLAANEYRDAYFAEPELLANSLGGYADALVARVEAVLGNEKLDDDAVVAILGAGIALPDGSNVRAARPRVSGDPRATPRLLPGTRRRLQLPPSRRARRLELPRRADHDWGLTRGDTQPLRLRSGSDRVRDPQRRRRSRRHAVDAAAVGHAPLGAPVVRVRRRVPGRA